MKSVILAAACAFAAFAPAQASAQIATPNEASLKLGQCLVGKSNGEDRILIAQWMGASMAMSPAMQEIVTVDPEVKDRIDREMAETFTRLMAEDCREQMATLIKGRDAAGIQAASGMLGQMAMQELLRDPKAMEALIAYAKYIDPAMMQKLGE
ncbi:hypothetical protein E3U23_04265 [Erythrobacter litoralis]|uniref:hypothetical protein n=1 Tax=Erythrobacter litoralis TaxID=39960 RepID=UPI002435CB2D|nr:hypothetical protein [Erythrobacter litoralis]MDG6078404.1 hypothetical protein [Erythrobacter litoralis]